ncbi:sialoadhesin-like [Cottoperca gobio]|uniref:Sialoadhesin-like n=1 Tax=Cottoperca gobio TaxID=56716 RepID=A0A6J2RL32_COTGO|nr:sialoadhesin-like [Cottoperca gobio]
MKRIDGFVRPCAATWSSSTGPCEVKELIAAADSGLYWCELGGQTSSTVNITVTGGAVILQSPVFPVMEGDAVTLSCREKKTSNLTADFYKDGSFMEKSSTGNLTLQSVSRSDEGLYSCSISGVAASPQSRLTVRAAQSPPLSPPPQLSLLLGIGVSVFCVALVLLVGLLRCRRRQTDPPTHPPPSQSLSSLHTGDDENLSMMVYQTVNLRTA